MKKFKKLIILGAAVLLIGATSVTALAATADSTPAEIVAGLTGRTADDVLAEKTESGATYGSIANNAGVLDQFKAQMLERMKAILDERVASGQITREQADAILAAKEANMQNCDGTGSGKGACGMGGGFGAGTRGGMGSGRGMGRGAGACGTFGG
jgi:hypothetical protein